MPHPPPASSAASARLASARNAVALAFALNGLVTATWMSRIPAVRDQLDLAPSQVGAVLFAVAAGSLLALPTAGFVVSKIGASRTALTGAVIGCGGLVFAGFGAAAFQNAVVTAAGLLAFGYGIAMWDVAINVEGAAVERELARSIMPRFHAAWSLGTVVAAGVGALAAAVDVPLDIHFAVAGVSSLIVMLTAVRGFLPRAAEADDDGTSTPTASVWAAWREPRTLLIGLMLLCFGLMEGIANDWLALGVVDGYDVDNAIGAAAFGVFVTAMTVGRTVGTVLIDRFGRLPVLRVSIVLAIGGVLLVVFGQTLPVAAVGIVCWGFGTALGFPLGMSAASDDPARAAGRVSVVSSIGYTAFLAGPPILGYLGDHEGVLRALLVAVVAAVVAVVVAPAARERRVSPPDRSVRT